MHSMAPLKLQKLFPFFFFCSLINRHQNSWVISFFGCYYFKSCHCWTWRGSDTNRVFSQPKVTRCATSRGHVLHRISKLPKITDRCMTSKYRESDSKAWSRLLCSLARAVLWCHTTIGYFRQFRNPVQSVSPGSGTSGHLITTFYI